MTTTPPRFGFKVSETDPGLVEVTLKAQTTHRAALDEHAGAYLADSPWLNGGQSRIVIIDAIEHGWHGATAEAAEKVEAIRTGYLTGELTLRGLFVAIEKLAEELKSEVGA